MASRRPGGCGVPDRRVRLASAAIIPPRVRSGRPPASRSRPKGDRSWIGATCWAGCRPVPRPAASTCSPGRLRAASPSRSRHRRDHGLPPLKITDITTILTAPNRVRLVIVKVVDQRAGPLRPGLCDVHPAGLRGADGRREVPQALPDRPRRRPDRGHLAVVLRQLVLAERPGAVQRHERRGHGALGHQGQAGEHARLSAAGRQVPVRRGALCPRQRPRRSRRSRTNARSRDGQGLPAHPRAGRPSPGMATYGAAADAARAEPIAEVDRADRSQERSGSPARYVRTVPKLFEHLRTRWATRSSCSTTSTSGSRPARRSACARSWRSTACSSSRTRCRPRRRTTSGSSAQQSSVADRDG